MTNLTQHTSSIMFQCSNIQSVNGQLSAEWRSYQYLRRVRTMNTNKLQTWHENPQRFIWCSQYYIFITIHCGLSLIHGQTSLHQLYIKKLSIKKVPTYVSCEYWQRKHMANEQQMNFMHRHISLTEWKIDQNCRAN